MHKEEKLNGLKVYTTDSNGEELRAKIKQRVR